MVPETEEDAPFARRNIGIPKDFQWLPAQGVPQNLKRVQTCRRAKGAPDGHWRGPGAGLPVSPRRGGDMTIFLQQTEADVIQDTAPSVEDLAYCGGRLEQWYVRFAVPFCQLCEESRESHGSTRLAPASISEEHEYPFRRSEEVLERGVQFHYIIAGQLFNALGDVGLQPLVVDDTALLQHRQT